MDRILVTGGAGMIGSNLVKRLVELKHDVFVVDNLWRGSTEYLKYDDNNYIIDMARKFFNIDLSIPNSIDEIIKNVDYVYHLADIVAGIGYVFNNQGIIFRQNMLINSNVINAARESPPKGFVYVGTACSFPAHLQNDINARPLLEEDQYPAAPESAYGWSKLMGEYETMLMEKEKGIPCSILSLHNVYGPPADYSSERGQVIPSLIRKAILYPDDQFIVWGSGKQGRAFVHVDDVVDALLLALERGLGHGVIQIGPDYCTTIATIAENIVEISGKDINIVYDKHKPEGDRGRCANYSKAKRYLNWTPQVEFKEGLAQLYKWVELDLKRKGRG